ncbi:hypothetical protein KP509_20G035100 [Ceratopteris richardii]|uniref:ABC transporter domain-containing protein n=1 Tax=Ceratopteris richardii TaxID=49495 RepID=A0A8T2SGJ6_CERRI|nr:hypothetical protein KP509_20G035100 [Ceratopteris richardii]
MTSALPDGSGLRHCRMVSNWPRVPAKTAFATGKLYSGSRALFLQVKDVSYRSPGTEVNILNNVNLDLPQQSLGLIFGRSGSGKTTLLQVLAGLLAPSEGIVSITSPLGDDGDRELEFGTTGIVFQFPERYFLTETVVEELTFGLSSRSQNPLMTHQLYIQLHQVALAVGLMGIPWDANPRSLSDGYKRRLALAAQLVRRPRLLLLDEPLAGLDWKARIDVAKLLANLKKEITLIVVSHDLKELKPYVDKAWRMDPGGVLTEASLPL